MEELPLGLKIHELEKRIHVLERTQRFINMQYWAEKPTLEDTEPYRKLEE